MWSLKQRVSEGFEGCLLTFRGSERLEVDAMGHGFQGGVRGSGQVDGI